ncbi:hypothetical protein BLS_000639 [Venturia inaequalis]|uniref:NADH dehydrogenase [ubiquinone] 1 alpha subcomplex subunit n=1 Tax=Venturia inaequalis TaxID=5025 RepID=A0A8H3UW98_VENIN|nr:hypothetical protein BLS_000639 [Venturia inaequalis]
MASRHGPLTKLWIQWKSSKAVPWRKRWLVGMDLTGNTFWEFTDQINIGRLRRIVEYDKNAHYADVKLARTHPVANPPPSKYPSNTLPPAQWIQWLRHTRDAPPSIQEQRMDIVRQAQMKQLAAQADAKWASKADRIDMPQRQEIASATLPQRPPEVPPEVIDPITEIADIAKETKGQIGVVTEVAKEEKTEASRRERKDTAPYPGLKLGKEGEQAPESWAPRPVTRR